jgi:hypothetical protein
MKNRIPITPDSRYVAASDTFQRAFAAFLRRNRLLEESVQLLRSNGHTVMPVEDYVDMEAARLESLYTLAHRTSLFPGVAEHFDDPASEIEPLGVLVVAVLTEEARKRGTEVPPEEYSEYIPRDI